MDTKKKLEEIGFYQLEDKRDLLCNQAIEYAKNAGNENIKSFESFPSFIPTKTPVDRNDIQLITDIGGTSTKVALRDTTSDGVDWTVLFEEKNIDLKPKKVVIKSFESFSYSLAKLIADKIAELKIKPIQISAVAFIWSNAIINKPRNDNAISAFVTDIESYKKGEWFIADLKNEDDLGGMLLKALKDVGFKPKQFLITNDAPLTMKALVNANGGMVASTGLNGTLIRKINNTEIICNGELGGRFDIEVDFLSQGDWIYNDKRANTIELLSAGRFLPLIFNQHIVELAKNGKDELKEISSYLVNDLREKRWVEFRAKDMNLLFSSNEEFMARRCENLIPLLNQKVLSILSELSREIFTRSAKLAAIVAFSTIANQIEAKRDFLIALDSRLAREVDFYLTVFNNELDSINEKYNINIKAEIVKPLSLENGKISVPMQGAANALDSLI